MSENHERCSGSDLQIWFCLMKDILPGMITGDTEVFLWNIVSMIVFK